MLAKLLNVALHDEISFGMYLIFSDAAESIVTVYIIP